MTNLEQEEEEEEEKMIIHPHGVCSSDDSPQSIRDDTSVRMTNESFQRFPLHLESDATDKFWPCTKKDFSSFDVIDSSHR